MPMAPILQTLPTKSSIVSEMETPEAARANFSGVALLFPLPNFVMFPHVIQPLHVFEPRYRELVADVMQDDRLIATAILKDGWELDYEGRPPIEPICSISQIVSSAKLDDGSSNLLLAGYWRAKIKQEFSADQLFRTADVELLDDVYLPSGASQRPTLQRALLDSFDQVASDLRLHQDQLDELMAAQVPLGVLTDIISFSLDLDVQSRLQLLGELNVDQRARTLLRTLRDGQAASSVREFPPRFSVN